MNEVLAFPRNTTVLEWIACAVADGYAPDFTPHEIST